MFLYIPDTFAELEELYIEPNTSFTPTNPPIFQPFPAGDALKALRFPDVETLLMDPALIPASIPIRPLPLTDAFEIFKFLIELVPVSSENMPT